MECCQNKNILKLKEMNVCTNSATIHGYTWIEYDLNLMNMMKIFITY